MNGGVGCSYLNGLEYIKSTAGVPEKLFDLVYKPNVKIQAHALALAFVVVNFIKEEGFALIHDAAEKTGQ
jgi:hypothetical protein